MSFLLRVGLCVGLLGLPAVFLAGPANAVETYPTSLSIQSNAAALRYLGPYQVVGALGFTYSDGKEYAAAGQPVDLQRRLAGTSTWATLQTQETRADGTFDFRAKAYRNAAYRMSYAGGSDPGGEFDLAPSVSAAKRLRVTRNLHDDKRVRRGRLYIAGNVDPGWAKKPVDVQRKTCRTCAWKRVATHRTSASGAYTVPVAAPRRGTWRYRLRTAGNTAYAESFSNFVYLVYRR